MSSDGILGRRSAMSQDDEKDPPEKGGAWSNWWPAPMVTSGSVLVAVILGAVCLFLLLIGGILFVYGLPLEGIGSGVVAVVVGWAAIRMLRRVL